MAVARYLSFILLGSSFLHHPHAIAGNYIDLLIDKAEDHELADSRGWRALLHYKQGTFGGWKSQADDPAFFLADDGKTNPQAELAATIRAMNAPVVIADEHPQCRFPARYHWLVAELKTDERKLPAVHCPELSKWFDTIKPGSLTLIFPAAYINSPSSMFGHTLLRVNPSDYRADSPLVAYALNYAADADATDSAIVFSIKGLIGGYPGIFSIVPYYEKIKEYSDLENRDVWEYELDFSPAEVDQLMRHAWEVRHINFDYFFLTENCSYHMLSLMEVARPELDLTDRFGVKAIPSDTVRAVFDEDLVTERVYRPSSTRILSAHEAQMSDADNELVIGITKQGIPVDEVTGSYRSDIDKARIYEQAYDYSRFLSTSDPTMRDARSKTNWQLLAARSGIPLKDAWEPVEAPRVRAEDGHRTGRVAIGAGVIDQQLDDEGYLSLQLRPAYHDVVDKVAGYSKAAQINFLDLNLRYYEEQDKLRLKKLTVINVLSLAPMDRYFTPIAWGVDIAVERQPTRNDIADAAQAVVNFGAATELFDYVNISLLGEANLKVANEYDKGYSAGVGAQLGLLVQQDDYSLQSTLKAVRFAAGEENLHQQFDISLAYHIGFNDSLRLTFERSRDYDLYSSDVLLAYHKYF
jgi:hypothetical protein